MLDALGDSTRRQILEVLRIGPASVAELAAQVPVSRPAVSQHLRILKAGELVAFETRGTRNVYRLDTGGLVALQGWLDEVWDIALASFETFAHDQHRQERRS